MDSHAEGERRLNEFKEGDHVTYWYPDSDDHGEKGVITKVMGNAADGDQRYRVEWEKDEPSTEPARHLRHGTMLSKETAAALAIYLALDAVEDEQVAAWIRELQAHANNN